MIVVRHGPKSTLRAACMLVVALTVAACVAACGGGGSKKTTSSATTAATGASPTTAAGLPSTGSATPLNAQFASTFAGAPSSQWLTVGGSLMHENYSPLTQITTSNVSQLKGVWHKHLGTAKSPIFSAEGQPVYDNGVLYISTGSDNVFAYQVSTGKLLWRYQPKPAIPLGTQSVICCGWDNRAAGIGGGMVYLGQLNGQVVGLDQKTGKVMWKTTIGTPKKGATVTMPITYYDGKVFAGVAGGEYEVRGFMEALNAKTGKPEWKFNNTDSGPHNSWGGKATLTGGAATWNAPSVDPKTNTIFYSTSNASPDYDARMRPGKNLYAASIVALNANTGKLKWYYQEVHHDIWDYDAPSETVLLNPKIHGKVVPAIAEPGKTGMLYVLNRNTGKPLYPTPEKPVGQFKAQKTWPTQPSSPLIFSPQKTSPSILAATKAAAAESGPQATKLKLTRGTSFDPRMYEIAPAKHAVVVPNTGTGGDNWEPSSFDEANDYYYVCSQSGARAGLIPNKVPKLSVGRSVSDTDITVHISNGFDSPGQLTAFDLNTGKRVWQVKFPDSCYSGTVDTAGGVVFVGRNKGQLQAYDANTGKLLWGFQTGAGANAPVAVFQQNGQEYVALYAGGNDLAGSPHGDNFWLFSLKGKLGPVKAGSTAGAGTHG